MFGWWGRQNIFFLQIIKQKISPAPRTANNVKNNCQLNSCKSYWMTKDYVLEDEIVRKLWLMRFSPFSGSTSFSNLKNMLLFFEKTAMKAQLVSITLSLSVIYTKPEGRCKSVVTIYCEGTSSARPHWSTRNMGSGVMVPRQKKGSQ